MLPGDVHEWTVDCAPNQAASITAFPTNARVQRFLSVETLVEANETNDGWTLHWKIKNAGLNPIDGYFWAWLLANNQGVDRVFNLGGD
jgi:hypothetical protein